MIIEGPGLRQEQRVLLRDCYRRDENAIPPVFRLRPVSNYPLEQKQWGQIQELLATLFQSTFGDEPPDSLRWRRYFSSATYQEIIHGALNHAEAGDQVLLFLRELHGMPPSGPDLATWTDQREGGPDSLKQHRLAEMKRRLLHLPGLNRANVMQHDEFWSEGDTPPFKTSYLETFADFVEQRLKLIINAELARLDTMDHRILEFHRHGKVRSKEARQFHGRESEVAQIQRYLEGMSYSWNHGPLLITGPGGSGKTALMAKAAEICRQRYPLGIALIRFIDLSPLARDQHTLLSMLIAEIATMRKLRLALGDADHDFPTLGDSAILCDLDSPPEPEFHVSKEFDLDHHWTKHLEGPSSSGIEILETDSVAELGEKLRGWLEWSRKFAPIVLLIDGLDQFPEEQFNLFLKWIPRTLPPDSGLILSLRTGERFTRLASVLPGATVIKLVGMTPGEGGALLDELLINASEPRRLTPGQRRQVLHPFQRIGHPLYIRIAAELCRSWRSYDEMSIPLPESIEALVHHYVDWLSDPSRHDPIVVLNVLRFLVVARDGLMDDELSEALWLRPEIRERLETTRHPDQPLVTRFPDFMLSHLMADLEPFLGMVDTQGGGVVRTFFHQEFLNAIAAKVLDPPTRREYHANLAQLFSPTPAMQEVINTAVFGGVTRRDARELFFHLEKAGLWQQAADLLLHPGYLLGKCHFDHVDDLIQEFCLTGRNLTHDMGGTATRFREFHLLMHSLFPLIRRGNARWSSSFILMQQILSAPEQSPLAIARKQISSRDLSIMRQRLLLPSTSFHPRTGRISSRVLEQNEGTIQKLLVLNQDRIVTLSDNGALIFWDLETGLPLLGGGLAPSVDKRWRPGDLEEPKTLGILLLPNPDQVLSWSGNGSLSLWRIQDGQEITCFVGHTGPVTAAREITPGTLLSWDETGTAILWSRSSGRAMRVLVPSTEHQPLLMCHKSGALLTGGLGDAPRMFVAHSGVESIRFEPVSEPIAMVSWLDESGICILGFGEQGTVYRWCTSTGALTGVYVGHREAVFRFIPLGDRFLVTLGRAGEIRCWDLDSDTAIAGVEGLPTDPLNRALELIQNPHHHSVFVLFADGGIGLWEPVQDSVLQLVVQHPASVGGLHLGQGEVPNISWSCDGTIIVWQLDGGILTTWRTGHKAPLVGMSILSDNSLILWHRDGHTAHYANLFGKICREIPHVGPVPQQLVSLLDGAVGMQEWDGHYCESCPSRSYSKRDTYTNPEMQKTFSAWPVKGLKAFQGKRLSWHARWPSNQEWSLEGFGFHHTEGFNNQETAFPVDLVAIEEKLVGVVTQRGTVLLVRPKHLQSIATLEGGYSLEALARRENGMVVFDRGRWIAEVDQGVTRVWDFATGRRLALVDRPDKRSFHDWLVWGWELGPDRQSVVDSRTGQTVFRIPHRLRSRSDLVGPGPEGDEGAWPGPKGQTPLGPVFATTTRVTEQMRRVAGLSDQIDLLLQLWNLQDDPPLIREWGFSRRELVKLTWDDPNTLVVCRENGVSFHRVADGAVIRSWEAPRHTKFKKGNLYFTGHCACFAPGGEIHLADGLLEGHSDIVLDLIPLDSSERGQRLISWARDATIRIWQVPNSFHLPSAADRGSQVSTLHTIHRGIILPGERLLLISSSQDDESEPRTNCSIYAIAPDSVHPIASLMVEGEVPIQIMREHRLLVRIWEEGVAVVDPQAGLFLQHSPSILPSPPAGILPLSSTAEKFMIWLEDGRWIACLEGLQHPGRIISHQETGWISVQISDSGIIYGLGKSGTLHRWDPRQGSGSTMVLTAASFRNLVPLPGGDLLLLNDQGLVSLWRAPMAEPQQGDFTCEPLPLREIQKIDRLAVLGGLVLIRVWGWDSPLDYCFNLENHALIPLERLLSAIEDTYGLFPEHMVRLVDQDQLAYANITGGIEVMKLSSNEIVDNILHQNYEFSGFIEPFGLWLGPGRVMVTRRFGMGEIVAQWHTEHQRLRFLDYSSPWLLLEGQFDGLLLFDLGVLSSQRTQDFPKM